MSLASPAKQDRIERHLSRQRGAGVRSLATTFGFTFGATAPQAEEHVKEAEPVVEPSAKRRKLDDTSASAVKEQGRSTRNHEPTSKSERTQKNKTRRRFEGVEQESVAQKKDSAENDSFLAVKKPAKARRVPRVRGTQAALGPSHPSPIRDEAPSRRPRRQAATAAIDKVSQGFVQEAQPIDKMRRNPVVEPSKRRATRKAAAAINELAGDNDTSGSATVLDPIKVTISESRVDPEPENMEPEKTEPKQREVTKRKKRATKNNVAPHRDPESHTAPDGNETLGTSRIPLAETTTNPILCSTSPDKPLKPSDSQVLQRSPIREKSPTKASVGSKNVVKGKRKPPKFAVSKDEPAFKPEADLVDVGNASKNQHVPESDKASGQEQLPETANMIDLRPKKRGRPGKNADAPPDQPLTNSSAGDEDANDHSVNEKPSGKKGKRKERERADQDRIAEPRPESRPLDDGEGVDWLFDDEKRGKRTRPEKKTRSGKQKSVKNIAKLPDVDLDDLLSNIAAFVPRKTESKRLIGRSRT